MLKLVDDAEWPADDDAVGQAAMALAIHDVQHPPKAMTLEELQAFEAMTDYCWKMSEKNRRWILATKEWITRERIAHDGEDGFSSFPIHYGKRFWRDYLKEAQIVIETAQRVMGAIEMAKQGNQSKDGKGT